MMSKPFSQNPHCLRLVHSGKNLNLRMLCSRSGYPDLRIVDLASKRVFYLDPKLYVSGSRDSSFRAFYFEPKMATNKVRDDAVHLVVGFEHELQEKNGAWKFTRWDLVDLGAVQSETESRISGE